MNSIALKILPRNLRIARANQRESTDKYLWIYCPVKCRDRFSESATIEIAGADAYHQSSNFQNQLPR